MGKYSQEQKDAWKADDANWKLKVFYFNKEDHRILPPKRFGIGWTINFAQPLSVLAFAAVIIAGTLLALAFPKR